MAELGPAEGWAATGCAASEAVPTLVPKHIDLHYMVWRGGSFQPRAENSTFLSLKASKTQRGVRDKGNSLLVTTNLNQGNNELGPKGKRLASKH